VKKEEETDIICTYFCWRKKKNFWPAARKSACNASVTSREGGYSKNSNIFCTGKLHVRNQIYFFLGKKVCIYGHLRGTKRYATASHLEKRMINVHNSNLLSPFSLIRTWIGNPKLRLIFESTTT
jgi:hypothetical protein